MGTGHSTRRPRLLAIGHGQSSTGYGRVLRAILPELTADFDVHLYDIHRPCTHLPRTVQDGRRAFAVHPNPRRTDLHGRRGLPALLDALRPDVLFLMHDLYLYGALRPVIEAHAPRARVVVYAPIDGEVEEAEGLRSVCGVDALVLFTEYARRQVESAFAELCRREPGLRLPPIEVVPHGVDVEFWCPPDQGLETCRARGELRARLFPENPELQGKVIVLNANRNQPRKRVDLTLEAFSQLVHRLHCDAWLYLHMGMRDRGFDVLALATRLGVADRLLLTTREDGGPNVSDEQLRLLYQACDIGLNTSTGEGWGLVAFEHGATGAAQVMPAHGVCRELWTGRAELVEPRKFRCAPGDFARHGVVDPGEVATALAGLCRDPERLRRQAEAARRTARDPRYRWPGIAGRFASLFAAA